MATAPAAAASPHQHGSDHGNHSGAAHASVPDGGGRHSPDIRAAGPPPPVHGRSGQWSAGSGDSDGHHPEGNSWHTGTESHGNGHSDQANTAVSHGVVAQAVPSAPSAAPTAAPSPVPAPVSDHGRSSGPAHQDAAGTPAAPAPAAHPSAPAPQAAPSPPPAAHPSAPTPHPAPAAAPTPAPAPAAATPAGPATAADHAAGLVGTAPALVSSGLFVPLRVPVVTAVVTAAPSPIPAQFFGTGSANRAATPTPAPAHPSAATTPAPAARAASPLLPGAFGEPMVVARGAWRGLSLQAATDLRIPIGMLVAVALFLLVQALVDRRDPKVSGAPEHGTDETIGFQ